MSLSPKHTTPFSVTDILSPIEEAYKKTTIEAAIPPLVSPYRTTSQHQTASAMSSMSGMGSMGGMAGNPYNYHVPQLSHHTSPAFSSQYCNGGDLSHYGDPMSSRHSSAASWYGTNPDPRLASKSNSYDILSFYFIPIFTADLNSAHSFMSLQLEFSLFVSTTELSKYLVTYDQSTLKWSTHL